MPKQNIYYAPIHKILQRFIPCSDPFCKNRAAHQYGKRNADEEGYDIKLLCDIHYREEFMKVNGLTEEDMINDITIQNCTY